jgi:AAA family ATP:ADP antiporter
MPGLSVTKLFAQYVQLKPGEFRAVYWSFGYFFSLLCGYYIIRPLRDEMGITGGVENLQWLFTGTFLVMLAAVPLFGWVSSRFPRRQFIPYVYYFFIANLLLFYLLFRTIADPTHIARGFFIWASVYNLFVVSVFWSFMADIFSNPQAKRLFGLIATGGTVGALTGPVITAGLATTLGNTNLLLVSGLFLALAVFCMQRLLAWRENNTSISGSIPRLTSEQQAMGGNLFDGIRLVLGSPYLLGICLMMLLFTTLATFLYFQQAQIVRDSFSDSSQRTAVFAAMDLAVNSLTILIQVFLTGRLVKWLGLAGTLALVPVLLGIGFIALGTAPVLAVLVVVQVIRRAGNYAITRPAREMLYVVLGREEKYKAKNFIDTVVYRGGDAMSAWIYTALRSIGLGLGEIAWMAVPLAGVWGGVAWLLGRQQTVLAKRAGVDHE